MSHNTTSLKTLACEVVTNTDYFCFRKPFKLGRHALTCVNNLRISVLSDTWAHTFFVFNSRSFEYLYLAIYYTFELNLFYLMILC